MIESLEKSFSFIQDHLGSEYQEEKEYIGIRNLLYGALINLFKFSYNKNKANQIVDDFEVSFPMWYSNSNIRELPLYKRVFVKLVSLRTWFMVYSLSKIHSIVVK